VTLLDRLLQRWRIAKVRPFIEPAARVLDVGCGNAALARQVPTIGDYVGIDPGVSDEALGSAFRLMRGTFPDVSPSAGEFDAVVMLACLEHVPPAALPDLARRANALLRIRGTLLITVPDARVDAILHLLSFLRVIDAAEMKADEHHGFDAERTGDVFTPCGFRLVRRERFQLGLNNCFVFEKTADVAD
jgi:2-polyprenyl-3-methyl-5-hydroxy-6-metoxy-1,4-benzoquinol methylase